MRAWTGVAAALVLLAGVSGCGGDGSSDLVAQIQQGAPADVFASADTANMDKLSTPDDLIGDGPENFASNTLEIAVPPDNPAGITSLQDLTEDGVNLVVCAPEVPCGSATQKVAEAAGLTFTPVSEEQSVTDVLNKVTTGEADAGLVYVTDVKGAGDAVQGITFPESADAVNVYPIATVADSRHADLAREDSEVTSPTKSPQSTRLTIAASGSTTNSAPAAAGR